MIAQKGKITKGKILPFEQTGEFFYKRGLNKLDRNNLLDAMVYYNKALERDPKNAEIRLSIAETLTEMYRFEESNRLLLTSFLDEKTRPSEYYFGIGMNFLGLKEYEHARESFEQYAYVDPEGEYIYETYDFLDALDESLEDGAESEKAVQDAQMARDMLDNDDFDGAIRILEGVLEQDPDDFNVRNNLALAYFCRRDFGKATEQMQVILSEEPENIQAHCNLAVFLHGAKDDEGAERECEYIAKAQTDDPEDLNRIGLALMEIGKLEPAFTVQKKLFRQVPYDQNTTHRMAQCAYQLEDYKFAAECYDRLLKVDPMDSIARYYRNECRRAAAEGKKLKTLMLSYQVPLDETIARIHKLNHYLNLEADRRRSLWQSRGSELEMLIRWGVQMGERSVKRAMLRLVATFEDEKAEMLLRDFLLQRMQPGDLKREVFGLLKHIRAKEPYLGYMDGELVESKVSLIKLLDGNLPDAYNEVLDLCMQGMQSHTQRCMMEAANLWSDYIASLDGFPEISKAQSYAFAAALEYAACRACDDYVTKGELCKRYGITLLRFNNALGKLMNVKRGEKEN